MTAILWNSLLSQTLSDQGLTAYLWNIDQDFFEWQGNLQGLLGCDPVQYPRRNNQFHLRLNPQDIPKRLAAVRSGAGFSETYRMHRGDGTQAEIAETATVETDAKTGERFLRGVLRIVDRDTAPKSVARNNTGLLHSGRILIGQKIASWGAAPQTLPHHTGYLLAVGIDRLSLFNEAFGAPAADDIIDTAGTRLRKIAGDTGVIERIDGDVFALFFAAALQGDMAAMARTILTSFRDMPLDTARGPVGIGVSIGGVAVHPDCDDAGGMIAKAEMAMQSAKRGGRGRFVSYNEIAGDSQNARQILQSGDDFIAALKANRVRLAFQPVVRSADNSVAFHECLIRFTGNDGKLHSAASFMPAIEKLGLSRLVDRHALRLAMQELDMFPDLQLSVNVSNQTLGDPDWLRSAVSALRDRPQVASRLIIEITESAAIQHLEKTQRIIQTLREMGCRIALDDFGAGYTAFSQLETLNVDMVKIDKSFVRGMAQKKNHLFVQALQSLAAGLNIQTVGEGAETMTEARLLASDGIDFIQGYAFGFPSVERVWLPKDHPQRKPGFLQDNNRKDSEIIAELMRG